MQILTPAVVQTVKSSRFSRTLSLHTRHEFYRSYWSSRDYHWHYICIWLAVMLIPKFDHLTGITRPSSGSGSWFIRLQVYPQFHCFYKAEHMHNLQIDRNSATQRTCAQTPVDLARVQKKLQEIRKSRTGPRPDTLIDLCCYTCLSSFSSITQLF